MVRDGAIIHEPTQEAIEQSYIYAYMQWLADERDLEFSSYRDLWQWSVDELDDFWQSIWDYFEVHSETPPASVLGRRAMPGAEWFPGARINFAGEYLRAAAGNEAEVAIIAESQTRDQLTYTHGELIDLIGRIRAGLVRLGVGIGDRVVAIMPNIPETAAAWLAAASLGAIWASAAPEFGPKAISDRFGQLEPTVLLVVDGYRYGDKDIDIRDRIQTVRDTMASVRQVVALDYNGRQVPDSMSWADFTSVAGPVEIEPVPFDHPLCVLFSSGTTGLPKAIVHGHGGLTMEAYKNHNLSWNLGPNSRLLWFSTTAWMIWNALVSTLLTGGSIVCVDGNPMWPDMDWQWEIAERTKATMMGLGPAFIMGCIKAGKTPTADHDLGALEYLAAAGSPLPAEGFVWIQEQFGDRAPLCVGSGGTDVCTGILQGYPIVPVYAGEISAKVLGVAAYAFDEAGNELIDELGELVITEPMPSMPVRFWGDDDMSRYRATYFEHYPGIMRFGDWVRFTAHGSSVVAGRSDATLNRGGVRIGTAEIYRVVEQMPGVADSLVVHLEDPDGGMGELILFVHGDDGPLGESGHAAIRSRLKESLSPRHVPNRTIDVDAVPRNLTGKKLELPVKKIFLGADVDQVVSKEAMANPDSLDQFVAMAGQA